MYLSITNRRIKNFCYFLLDKNNKAEKIGFVDIGSGGNLKEPWALIPSEKIIKFDFEPTGTKEGMPLCVSNKSGRNEFFVAFDERGSSFHQPYNDFIGRYGFEEMRVKKVISVECTTLDEYFSGRYQLIDAMDINVEGHDFQVLQGASKLLDIGAKLNFSWLVCTKAREIFRILTLSLERKALGLLEFKLIMCAQKNTKIFFLKENPYGVKRCMLQI